MYEWIARLAFQTATEKVIFDTANFSFLEKNGILCVSRLEGIRGFVCVVREGSSQLREDRGWSDRYACLPLKRKNEKRNSGGISFLRNTERKYFFLCVLFFLDVSVLAHHTALPM